MYFNVTEIVCYARPELVKDMQCTSDLLAVWSKPHDNPIRMAIYIRHVPDLSSSFGQVFLIDANGIAPYGSRFGRAPKVT
ncbi:hypothetical protein CGMCC3_g3403 [Colletotrichum fructicola]|nr:uncharacterized protein CGMCC3_g3403 [Colletotrichum fructicola]KAE9580635.1 hypothetical protein CGMCC3_g3403 [Colletotrichum fructicola]